MQLAHSSLLMREFKEWEGKNIHKCMFSPYRTRTRSEIAMLNIEYLFIHYLFITNLSTDHVYVVYLYKTTSVCTLGTYLAYHLK